jgi:hypothetical protein
MQSGCESFRSLGRRQFFRVGGAGLFGMTLADLFRAQAATKATAARQVLFIWLGGGPPHMDMFDMKPEAGEDTRSAFKPIQTNVPGIDISELMPNLAKRADKYTILRSVASSNDSHDADLYWLTGNPRRVAATPKYPTYGNVVAKVQPAPAAVPSFVSLGAFGGFSGSLNESYLGPAYDPLLLNPDNPNDQVRNMLSPAKLDLSQFAKEEALLKSLDQQLRQLDAVDPLIAGLDQFQQKAFDMIRSPRLREALDLSKEPSKSAERYRKAISKPWQGGGPTKLLAARRLLEAGIPFVFVPLGYWDLHQQNFQACREQVPALEAAVAALLDDLEVRGLLDTTIVAMLGEMGRTPKIDRNGGGRHHWGAAQFVFVAGGGFKGGTVVGATDKIGAHVTDRYYKVESFGRTLYHLLGIDAAQELYTTSNRPLKIILEDAPLIREALA